MAYSTKADLEGVIGANDVAALSTVDGAPSDAAIVAAIAEADALIDSYAIKRDDVPYDPAPATIKNLSVRMAIRFLRRDRRMTITQDITDDEADRKWLEALAKGLVSAGPNIGGEPELAVDKYGTRENFRDVTRNKLKGFW